MGHGYQRMVALVLASSCLHARCVTGSPLRALKQNSGILTGDPTIGAVDLVGQVDAAAPGPVDILAASPAGAQAAIFANKLEAALKRGLPEAVSTEDTNSGNQADTLAFLQGIINSQNQALATTAAASGATATAQSIANAPAASSVDEAAGLVAALLSQNLAMESLATNNAFEFASGPGTNHKELYKATLAADLLNGIESAQAPDSAFNLIAELVSQNQVSETFAGTNLPNVQGGVDTLEAAALAAALGGQTGSASASTPTNLANNGL